MLANIFLGDMLANIFIGEKRNSTNWYRDLVILSIISVVLFSK